MRVVAERKCKVLEVDACLKQRSGDLDFLAS